MAFSCPDCYRVSHNPNDEFHQYCAACHKFFDEEYEPKGQRVEMILPPLPTYVQDTPRNRDLLQAWAEGRLEGELVLDQDALTLAVKPPVKMRKYALLGTCPNCREPYEWAVGDDEYPFRLVHNSAGCPYNFDFMHTSRADVIKIFEEYRRSRWGL